MMIAIVIVIVIVLGRATQPGNSDIGGDEDDPFGL